MNEYRVELSYLGIAVAIVMGFLLVSLGTCQAHWFGRAGVFLVLSAVVVETRLLARNSAKPSVATQKEWLAGIAMISGLSKAGRSLEKIAHIFILGGSIIWAYGDLAPVCH